MMMNSCWPYGGSTQQLNLASLDRPLYDSRTLAMLARQYQPSSIMSALLSLSVADDNNNNSQRLTSTTNSINNSNNNSNNNTTSDHEQTNENNSNSNSTNSTKKLWRPLDIMR